jgi:hypothetical protein
VLFELDVRMKEERPVARWRPISVPWSQVIDRMSPGGKSCMRVTRAVCSESASLRGRCTSRTIRVWRSTSVPIAEP